MTAVQVLFLFKGRINRRRFWSYFIGATIIIASLVWPLARSHEVYVLKDLYWDERQTNILRQVLSYVLMGLSFVVFALWLWITAALLTKRLHDFGWSGWWCLLVFLVPIGGILLGVMLSFHKPDPGGNKYGDPPS